MTQSIADRIRDEVSSWPGVTAQSFRGGMIFFHVGRREIGHLHGERMADLPFPVRIRKELVDAGKAELHYLHPATGWLTYYLRREQDIADIVNLFRLNYERPWLSKSKSISL